MDRKEALRAQLWGTGVPPHLRLSPPSEPVQRKEENRTGLPDTLKEGVESLSGLSLDDVQVHYNSSKPAEVQALAYTQGTEIHVGTGQEEHLAHEAWHVVQQKQGRVDPMVQVKEMAINCDQELEREANTMGARANKIPHEERVGRSPAFLNEGAGEMSMITASLHNQIVQPMFRFLFPRPSQAFPNLKPGPGNYALQGLPLYPLKHNFAEYDIDGSFEANTNIYCNVTIKYIRKTDAAQGFGDLFQKLEESARQLRSPGITVRFEQCKSG